MTAHLPAGSILNRNCYKITGFIAQGGFGMTYLAEEIGYFKKSGFEDDQYIASRYPEKVVIKELYFSDYCYRDEATGLVNISNVQRKVEFEKLVNKQLEEGKILRRLTHPHIIRTRDIFKENSTAYMVMDHVDSIDLDEMIKKTGKLQKEKALKYIRQVLVAAHYIHERKILHLDITPSNMLIKKDTDEVVLIDFGASLTYTSDNKASNNTTKMITGMKKHFAPVEQSDIDNLKSFDASFDTYAIGASLYYMLTGKLPPVNSLIITGKEKLVPPSENAHPGQVSEYLDAVVLKSMAPKFHDRFSTAKEFEHLLDREEEYFKKIGEINELIKQQQYKEAITAIEDTVKELPETTTLVSMKNFCQSGIEKKRNEEQYQLFISQGHNWFRRQEYTLARNEFRKAESLLPHLGEASEQIILCDKAIADEENNQKIKELLPKARKLIHEGKKTEAMKMAESVLSFSPGNKEAMDLLAEISSLKKEEFEVLQKKAEELYNEEQYEKAEVVYRQLAAMEPGDTTIQERIRLLNSQLSELNDLSDRYNELAAKLKRIDIRITENHQSFNTIKTEFDRAEKQRVQLRLASSGLRQLADQLKVNIQGKAIEIDQYLDKTRLIAVPGTMEEETEKTKINRAQSYTADIIHETEPVREKKLRISKKLLIFAGLPVLLLALGLLLFNKKGRSGDKGEYDHRKEYKPFSYYIIDGKQVSSNFDSISRELNSMFFDESVHNTAIITPSLTSPATLSILNDYWLAGKPGSRLVYFDSVSYSYFLEANEATYGVAAFPLFHLKKIKSMLSIGSTIFEHDPVRIPYYLLDTSNRPFRYSGFEIKQSEQDSSYFQKRVLYATTNDVIKVLISLYSLLQGEMSLIKLDKAVFDYVKELADRLIADKGKALVYSAIYDRDVQIVVNAINEMLGANGTIIDFSAKVNMNQMSDHAFDQMVSDCESGTISSVLLHFDRFDFRDKRMTRFLRTLETGRVKNRVLFTSYFHDSLTKYFNYIIPVKLSGEIYGDDEFITGKVEFRQNNDTVAGYSWQDYMLMASLRKMSYTDYFRSYWTASLGSASSLDNSLREGRIVAARGVNYLDTTRYSGGYVAAAISRLISIRTGKELNKRKWNEKGVLTQ